MKFRPVVLAVAALTPFALAACPATPARTLPPAPAPDPAPKDSVPERSGGCSSSTNVSVANSFCGQKCKDGGDKTACFCFYKCDKANKLDDPNSWGKCAGDKNTDGSPVCAGCKPSTGKDCGGIKQVHVGCGGASCCVDDAGAECETPGGTCASNCIALPAMMCAQHVKSGGTDPCTRAEQRPWEKNAIGGDKKVGKPACNCDPHNCPVDLALARGQALAPGDSPGDACPVPDAGPPDAGSGKQVACYTDAAATHSAEGVMGVCKGGYVPGGLGSCPNYASSCDTICKNQGLGAGKCERASCRGLGLAGVSAGGCAYPGYEEHPEYDVLCTCAAPPDAGP